MASAAKEQKAKDAIAAELKARSKRYRESFKSFVPESLSVEAGVEKLKIVQAHQVSIRRSK